MKMIKLSALLLGALLYTGCIETENKNHPPFEPTTIQTEEQKDALMKLAKKHVLIMRQIKIKVYINLSVNRVEDSPYCIYE